MYCKTDEKVKELKIDEGAMEMITESSANETIDLYVLAIKCTNVHGESMNVDVEVCKSSKIDAHVDDPFT